MILGVSPGASGDVILPGVGASLGEVCGEYFNGKLFKTDLFHKHTKNMNV